MIGIVVCYVLFSGSEAGCIGLSTVAGEDVREDEAKFGVLVLN